MESAKIVLLCIVSAMLYGILHDQVTTRVCVEYFTIGHPPVFKTAEPTFLAIGWGIIATWWVGALLSFLAVPACRLGAWPKLDAAQLIRPIGCLLIIMACASLLAGIAAYFSAKAGVIRLLGWLAYRVSAGKHVAFLADLWRIAPPTASVSWEELRSASGQFSGVGTWRTKAADRRRNWRRHLDRQGKRVRKNGRVPFSQPTNWSEEKGTRPNIATRQIGRARFPQIKPRLFA